MLKKIFFLNLTTLSGDCKENMHSTHPFMQRNQGYRSLTALEGHGKSLAVYAEIEYNTYIVYNLRNVFCSLKLFFNEAQMRNRGGTPYGRYG